MQILFRVTNERLHHLPTKDPRHRENLLPTQRKPNKISQSLIHNQVPNIPTILQYTNRIPIQGNPIIPPTYPTTQQTNIQIKIIIALTKVHII